jgi:hypothetical protein
MRAWTPDSFGECIREPSSASACACAVEVRLEEGEPRGRDDGRVILAALFLLHDSRRGGGDSAGHITLWMETLWEDEHGQRGNDGVCSSAPVGSPAPGSTLLLFSPSSIVGEQTQAASVLRTLSWKELWYTRA